MLSKLINVTKYDTIVKLNKIFFENTPPNMTKSKNAHKIMKTIRVKP